MKNHHWLLLAGALSLAGSGVQAAGNAPQPSICTRACWGATAASGIVQMSSLTRAIVHHTAGSEFNTTGFEASKANVRAIQSMHKNNGWGDIGYHFLVDKFGNIFEGRSGSMSSLPRGAHDATNTNSFGFNVMGYFHPTVNNVPTPAMMNSLYAVIAWRMPAGWTPYGSPGVYGPLGNNVGRIDSHRRVKSTACPGDHVHNPYIGNDVNSGVIRAEVQTRMNGALPMSSGPDAVSYESGRIDVVIRGTDSALWHRFFGNNVWSGWAKIGGTIASDPTICSWGPGRLDVFARGTNNSLWHIYYYNGWSAWEDMGGTIVGAPDATCWGNGHIDVATRGTDNGVHMRTYDAASGWGAWYTLGGVMTEDPSICSWGPGRLDLFIRGQDNALWHRPLNGGVRASWVSLGGTLASGPDAACWSPGRIDVVVRGTNGHAYHRFYENGWSTFADIGGSFTGNLSASSWGGGRLDLWGRGGDGHLWHQWFQNGWGSWQDLGGALM